MLYYYLCSLSKTLHVVIAYEPFNVFFFSAVQYRKLVEYGQLNESVAEMYIFY